jgi:hypothetical protein
MKSLAFFRIASSLCLISVISIAEAQRMPTVTFTVSGASGNWTLDFTLQSNLAGGEGDLYFFGLSVPSGRNIIGSPANWDPNANTGWNNAHAGGSNKDYNNIWITSPSGNGVVTPGSSLSGFQVLSTDTAAPVSIDFFTYASGGTYNGNDYFDNRGNPGWEGSATRAVPEPATFLSVGLGLVFLARKRRSNT